LNANANWTLKQSILAVVAGSVLGLTCATIMTTLDWRFNPAGIFHDAQGTHWNIVWETAISWFVPVALLSTILAALSIFLILRYNK